MGKLLFSHLSKEKESKSNREVSQFPDLFPATVYSEEEEIFVIDTRSLIDIFCFSDLLNGGDASQFYLPLFETDLHHDAQHAGRFCIIMLTFLTISAILLIWGIIKDVRGLMLPWMSLWAILCLGQAMFGLWLIFGYYIYLEGVFAALVDFAWMSYNIYCWYVVRNHYRNVKWFQSPDIEVLQEYAN